MPNRLHSRRIAALLSGLIAFFGICDANAECVCGSIPEPVQAFKQANTAFIGTVKRIRKSPLKKGYNEVLFSLMQKLKGFQELPVEEVYIFTPTSIDDCSYDFTEGQDYVVFAQGNPAGLSTTPCLGTIFLDNAAAHIDPLLKLAAQEPK